MPERMLANPGLRSLTILNDAVNCFLDVDVSSRVLPRSPLMKATPPGWPRISSSIFYDDPSRAIDWLCRAFAFEVRLKVEGDGGEIHHSELTYGDGVVCVGSSHGTAHRPDRGDRRSPREIGGANTQSLFMYIEDARAHCERARAAGARIVTEPKVSDYGEDYWADLSYEAVDPEGHHWWFSERLRSHGDGSAHGGQ